MIYHKTTETEGISLITAVKNRSEYLKKSLTTWLKYDEIGEVIIVDWSSSESIIPLIESFGDDRINLAVVPNQKYWILSEAYNLAARLTTKNKILKLDSDVLIVNDFFEECKLEDGIFFTGNWMQARNKNETHLNGSLFISRNDFFKANGYNEYIKKYGWDDDDLYNRLINKGLERKYINNDFLFHIEHKKRFKSQNTGILKNIEEDECTTINIHTNRELSKIYQWDSEQKMNEFSISKVKEKIFLCEKVGDSNFVSEYDYHKAVIQAIKKRIIELNLSLPKHIQTEDDSLLGYYRLYFETNGYEKRKSISKIFDKINTSVEDVISEKEAVKKNMEQLSRELIEKNVLLTKMNQENSFLMNENQLIKTHLLNLEADHKDVVFEIERLKRMEGEFSDLKNINEVLNKEINNLNLLLEKRNEEVNELNNKLIIKKQEIVDSCNRCNELDQNVKNERKKSIELLKKNFSLEKEYKSLRRKIILYERMNVENEKELKTKKEELKNVTQEMAVIQDLVSAIMKDNRFYKKKFEEMGSLKQTINRNRVLLSLLKEKGLF